MAIHEHLIATIQSSAETAGQRLAHQMSALHALGEVAASAYLTPVVHSNGEIAAETLGTERFGDYDKISGFYEVSYRP